MRELDPVDPALLDRRRRLLNVTAARTIAADPSAIWAVIGDHATWTTWHDDYEIHEPVGDQVTGVGARFRTSEWLIRSESVVARWEPDRVLGLQVVEASTWLRWLMRGYYTELDLEPAIVEGRPGCRVRYRVAMRATWLFWILGPYSLPQSLGSVLWAASASLRKLDRLITGPAAD